MSIERGIIQRLFESRGLVEAGFNKDGSEYSAVFGKYYKDSEPISREDYFRAKGDPVDNPDTEEASEWVGGNPWDDDLFFQNAEKLGLETGSDDLQVGDKELNFDYAILNKPVKFYHATLSGNVNSILKSGLKKSKQGKSGNKHVEAVYLSGSAEGISKWRGEDTKVVEVTLPAGTKVYQDRQSNAVFVTSDIPQDYIQSV